MTDKSLSQLAAENTSLGLAKPAAGAAQIDPAAPIFRAPVTVDRIRQAALKLAAAPKPGSKEAQVRALREANAERAPDSVSEHTIKLSELEGGKKLAAAVKPAKEKQNDFTKAAQATTSEESVPMRTNTKVKTARKAKEASKAKKAPPARRKPKTRAAAPLRKAQAAPLAGAQAETLTKGEQIIAALRAGWTSSPDLQTEHEWKPHTLRGFLSRIGQSVKDGGKGLKIERRAYGGVTQYRITN